MLWPMWSRLCVNDSAAQCGSCGNLTGSRCTACREAVQVWSTMTGITHVGLAAARGTLPKLSDRAAGGERIILTLHGRDHCAIVSLGSATA